MTQTATEISLREFWRVFAKQVPALSRIELPALPAMIHGLGNYFGNLTIHGVQLDSDSAIRLECKQCRNCTVDRKQHVCETHCGVIAGTTERLLGHAVHVEFVPEPISHNCRVTITKK